MRAHLIRAAVPAAAAVLAAALAAGACGVAGADEPTVTGRDELTVGVNADQPGVAERLRDGSFDGFDIDIADEVVRRLGVPGKNVRYKAVTSATRDRMLNAGDVDLVVASYSITPGRARDVMFAGPYYVAHQDILVRATDAPSITNVRDLTGRRICEVPGSVSYPRVRDERGIAVQPVRAEGYGDCLTRLSQGALDAVSTDDVVLSGLAARAAEGDGPPLKVVNAPFSDERYGIGVMPGDIDGCEAINKAITDMYSDGTIPYMLKRWFGRPNLAFSTTVPQFEGCV